MTTESVLLLIKAWELGCFISLTDSKKHSLLPAVPHPIPCSSKNSCSRALGRGSASAVGGWVGVGVGVGSTADPRPELLAGRKVGSAWLAASPGCTADGMSLDLQMG